HRLELLAAHQLGPRRDRRLDQCPLVRDLAEDQEPPVAQRRDRRHWGAHEALPARRDRPRLHPQLLGAAQHLGDADRLRPETVADLLGIGPEPVKAQQRYQRRQALIGCAVFVLSTHIVSVSSRRRVLRGHHSAMLIKIRFISAPARASWTAAVPPTSGRESASAPLTASAL